MNNQIRLCDFQVPPTSKNHTGPWPMCNNPATGRTVANRWITICDSCKKAHPSVTVTSMDDYPSRLEDQTWDENFYATHSVVGRFGESE